MTTTPKRLAFDIEDQIAKGNYQGIPAALAWAKPSPVALRVWYVINWHGHASGECRATQQTIAAEAGTNDREVRKALTLFRKVGAINPTKKLGDGRLSITFPALSQNVALPAATDPNLLQLRLKDFVFEQFTMEQVEKICLRWLKYELDYAKSDQESEAENEKIRRKALKQIEAFKLTEMGKAWTASGGYSFKNENVEAWEAFIAACPDSYRPDVPDFDWKRCPPLYGCTRGADGVWMYYGAPREMRDRVEEAFGDEVSEWTAEQIYLAAEGLDRSGEDRSKQVDRSGEDRTPRSAADRPLRSTEDRTPRSGEDRQKKTTLEEDHKEEDHREEGHRPSPVLAHNEQPANGNEVESPPLAPSLTVEEAQQLLEDEGFTDCYLVTVVPEGLTRSSLLRAARRPNLIKSGATARILVGALGLPSGRLKYTGSETFLVDALEACPIEF